MWATEPYRRAIQMQRVIAAQALEPGTKPLERASLARVWCELEETKRKLRMKPLPKAIEVTAQGKPKSKSRAGEHRLPDEA